MVVFVFCFVFIWGGIVGSVISGICFQSQKVLIHSDLSLLTVVLVMGEVRVPHIKRPPRSVAGLGLPRAPGWGAVPSPSPPPPSWAPPGPRPARPPGPCLPGMAPLSTPSGGRPRSVAPDGFLSCHFKAFKIKTLFLYTFFSS